MIEADDSPCRDRWSWHKLYFAVPVDEARIAAAARASAEAGVWNVPTLTVKAKIDRPEVMESRLDDPRLRYLPADLVLLEASPLDDISHIREIAGVMARGRWLSAGDLQALLDELARE